MSKTYEKGNEALAILAQRGCEVVREKARDLLLRRNEGLIYDKALTYWNYVIGSDIDRSLTLDDLVQLGRIKFCEALARLLANGLHEDGYLAKINFQNYSSQDALNSLIGSPAGYIGCDHGELSDKIGKTKIGVLLCDEFEKTTRPVSLFFLELLEDGKFTDSMAREYYLDGYIIVFTSNLQSESEYKKAILPELQTRFDLVCEFEKPNENEKRKFLELLLEKAKQKHAEAFAKFTMTQQDEEYLLGFDCSALSALRDIKRVFNNRLMDLFEAKGI